jgi:hypothetical protein
MARALPLAPSAEDQGMPERIQAAAVEVAGERRLCLKFDEGAEGDLSALPRHGLFEPLGDPDEFRTVRVDQD